MPRNGHHDHHPPEEIAARAMHRTAASLRAAASRTTCEELAEAQGIAAEMIDHAARQVTA